MEYLKLKQELYPKVIKYISTLAKFEHTSNIEEKKKLVIKENADFNDFYFCLSLMATDELLQKFNELRNKIQNEQLSRSQDVQEIIKLLRSL